MKTKLMMTAVLSVLFGGTSATAHATPTAKLITPTLWAVGGAPASPSAYLACNLTNVSDETRTVRVRIISNGSILLDSGYVSVDPLFTTNHFIEGLPGGGPIYCEFTVEGFKLWYRGAAKLFRFTPDTPEATDTTDFVAIPAT
jgi:hypothetical protein